MRAGQRGAADARSCSAAPRAHRELYRPRARPRRLRPPARPTLSDLNGRPITERRIRQTGPLRFAGHLPSVGRRRSSARREAGRTGRMDPAARPIQLGRSRDTVRSISDHGLLAAARAIAARARAAIARAAARRPWSEMLRTVSRDRPSWMGLAAGSIRPVRPASRRADERRRPTDGRWPAKRRGPVCRMRRSVIGRPLRSERVGRAGGRSRRGRARGRYSSRCARGAAEQLLASAAPRCPALNSWPRRRAGSGPVREQPTGADSPVGWQEWGIPLPAPIV